MPGRRLTAVLIAASALSGAVGAVAEVETRPTAATPQPGAPFPSLTDSDLALFGQGRRAFESQKTIPQGLGPLFNEISCSRCHNKGGVGGAGIQALTFVGRSEGGSYDGLLAQGGPLIAQASVKQLRADSHRLLPGCKLSAEGELVPGAANVITRRRTTPLFGLGLVEATPDWARAPTASAATATRPRARCAPRRSGVCTCSSSASCTTVAPARSSKPSASTKGRAPARATLSPHSASVSARS